MRVVDASEFTRLVSIERAIDAVEAAFRARDADTPPRQHIPVGDAELLFMPAWNPRAAGVKLVTVNPANADRGVPLINGTYLLFDRETLQPAAAIDAAALTAVRTAAVSGVATRALADPGSRCLAIFGAGVQAHSHLDAMIAVRSIAEVVVVSRSPERAEALASRARDLGLSASTARPDEAVARADIVCTCTTSSAPVFDGHAIEAPLHVNAVGSYKKDSREIDSETVRRADAVVVETLEVMGESGDLAIPLEERVLDRGEVRSLSDALTPQPEAGKVTLFKSVGQAFEDLAVAEVVAATLG